MFRPFSIQFKSTHDKLYISTVNSHPLTYIAIVYSEVKISTLNKFKKQIWTYKTWNILPLKQSPQLRKQFCAKIDKNNCTLVETIIFLKYFMFWVRKSPISPIFKILINNTKETTWKGKYQRTDNTKNRKRKGKLLPKNEEISGRKANTNTWKVYWNTSTITDVFFEHKRYIYSFLIKKDICDHQNISIKLPCVCVCLSSGDLFIFQIRVFPFFFPIFCVIINPNCLNLHEAIILKVILQIRTKTNINIVKPEITNKNILK